MIGYWHDTVVCLSVSVCLSVTILLHCSSDQDWCMGVQTSKVYHPVPMTSLPIHFFGHFCCRKYRSSTTHSGRKTNRRYFRLWNSDGQRLSRFYYPFPFPHSRPSRRGIFGGSVLQLYRIRSTIGLLSVSYTV